MPNTLEGVTALQCCVAQALRNAGIPEEYVSSILIAIEAGEEAREQDARAITILAEEQEREARHSLFCKHGFLFRDDCPTCLHFDEIEARERYLTQSEQST